MAGVLAVADGMPMPALLEEWMMVLDENQAKETLYPEVDDEMEIDSGEHFLVTVQLKKSEGDGTEEWALPATARLEEDGLLFDIANAKIWETNGLERVETVTREEVVKIRYYNPVNLPQPVLIPANDQNTIEEYWEDNGIGGVLEACGDVLLADDKHFIKYMKGNVGSPTFEHEKWIYLKNVMLKLCKLTVAQWMEKRPANLKKITTTELAWFQEEYLRPTLAEHQSPTLEVDQTTLKNMKPSVNAKYITLMMDMAVSDEGPLHREARKNREKMLGRKQASSAEVTRMVKAAAETTAAIKVLTMQLKLSGQIEINEVEESESKNQDKVKEVLVIDEGSEDKAKEYLISGNSNCMFQVVQVLGDKVNEPNCEIELSAKKEALARATVLYQAEVHFAEDPSDFCALHGMTYQEYYSKNVAQATSKNWGDQPEATYFTKDHPALEIKILKLIPNKSLVMATSTAQESDEEREWVGFCIHRPDGGGHYNLGTIVKGDTEETRYLFKAGEEAEAAQALLQAMMLKKNGRRVSFAPIESPSQSKEDFIKNTMSVIMDDSEPPAQNNEVEVINRQAREAEKRRSEEVESRRAIASRTAAATTESARLINKQAEAQLVNERFDHLEGLQAEAQLVNERFDHLEGLIKKNATQQQESFYQQRQQSQEWQQHQEQQAIWKMQQLDQRTQQRQQPQPTPQLPRQPEQRTQSQPQMPQLPYQQHQQPYQQQQPYQPQQAQQQSAHGWGSTQHYQQPQQQQPLPSQLQPPKGAQPPQHAQQQGAPGWQQLDQPWQRQPLHSQLQPPKSAQPPQQAQQQQSAPARGSSQPAWGRSSQPAWGKPARERHDPVVVVFGDGDKKGLKELLKSLSPSANSAVQGVQQVMMGQPRCLLYAKASDAALVQTLIPLLEQNGVNAAVYKDMRTGQPSKAQASSTGLATANASVGVCGFYGATPQQPCPYGDQCKFMCYGGQPRC
jgi:hypothetical protein